MGGSAASGGTPASHGDTPGGESYRYTTPTMVIINSPNSGGNKMKVKESKFLKQQKMAAAIGLTAIAGIIIYMANILITDIPLDGFVEGEHYHLIENPRRIRGDKTEIMEFFSYGCVHCYNFDDDLEDWVDKNKSQINFIRTPLIGSEIWRRYGRTYYTMQELGLLEQNHSKLFREIHARKKILNTTDKLSALLIDGSEVSAVEFNRIFNSSVINQKVTRAGDLARRYKIASVPNLVVNGKYLVRAGGSVGLSRMLDIMDYLIEMENAEAEISPAAD